VTGPSGAELRVTWGSVKQQEASHRCAKTKSFWCRWFYTRSGQAILYSRFGAPRNVNEKDWSHLVAEVLLVTSG